MKSVQAYSRYASAETAAATPGRVVVMSYDAMVRFLRNAEDSLEQGDFEAFNNFVQKAQVIISVLAASLDSSVDPGLCDNLASLYDWFYLRLTEANIKGDAAILREVRGQLSELRECWQAADEQSRRDQAGIQPELAASSSLGDVA